MTIEVTAIDISSCLYKRLNQIFIFQPIFLQRKQFIRQFLVILSLATGERTMNKKEMDRR